MATIPEIKTYKIDFTGSQLFILLGSLVLNLETQEDAIKAYSKIKNPKDWQKEQVELRELRKKQLEIIINEVNKLCNKVRAEKETNRD